MPFQLVTNTVNLKETPAKVCFEPITQVTLGDLHSNAIKLIHSLVRYGICEIDAGTFQGLLKQYEHSNPTEADKKHFIEIIEKKLKVVKKDMLLRLIGDIFADRGQNDLYVLAILDLLHQHHVPVTVLISNHDIELIRAYAVYKANGGIFNLEKTRGILEDQSGSLRVLERSIGIGKTISNAEFERLMEKVYFPKLKLIDYSLSEKEPKHLTIFTHAPIDLEIIESIGKKLSVPYQAETIEALIETIDKINQKFSAYVQNGHFDLIYDASKIPSDGLVSKTHGVECVAWNRNEDLKGDSTHLSVEQITFVYGHTKRQLPITRVNIKRVDNQLGKAFSHFEEEDPVFISDEPFAVPVSVLLPLESYLSENIFEANRSKWFTKKGILQDRMREISKLKKAIGCNTHQKEMLEREYAHLEQQVEAFNALLCFNFPEDLNQFNPLFELIHTDFIDKHWIKAIKQALSILQDYAAGTAVSEHTQSIYEAIEKNNFNLAQTKIETLTKQSFEGLGGRLIHADQRSVLEKAWYNVVAGIRFFLSLMTSIFTKKANHENKVARYLLDRPFFFQKPTTKGEDALIEANLNLLKEGSQVLAENMGHSFVPKKP